MKNIYVTITTLVDWQEKLEEARELGIKEAAVFLTGLADKEQEKEFLEVLSESGIEYVPFVHLRNTTPPEMVRLFVDKYHTKVFNIHLEDRFPPQYNLSEFKDKIYIENTSIGIEHPEALSDYAGICLDVAHWENERINNPEGYKLVEKEVLKHPIGCAHLSAIRITPHHEYENEWRVDYHLCKDLTEFDYLKRYEQYLPDIMAIELNNDLKTQLEVRDYVKKILNI